MNIQTPKNDKQGLINFIQMIASEVEAGNTEEALLKATDLMQDLQSCSFSWIDPNQVSIEHDGEKDEPVQVTQIATHEYTKDEVFYRNSYYI